MKNDDRNFAIHRQNGLLLEFTLRVALFEGYIAEATLKMRQRHYSVEKAKAYAEKKFINELKLMREHARDAFPLDQNSGIVLNARKTYANWKKRLPTDHSDDFNKLLDVYYKYLPVLDALMELSFGNIKEVQYSGNEAEN